MVYLFAFLIVPLDFKFQKEKSHLCDLHCFVPAPGMYSLHDRPVVDLPLPGGAAKASHIQVHLTRALEGEQEFTYQELQRRGGIRPSFQWEGATEKENFVVLSNSV